LKVKNKLTIQFALIVAFILMLFSTTVFWLSADYRLNEFYLRLKDKSQTTARLLLEVKETDSELFRILDKSSTLLLYEEHIIVFNRKGEQIFNSNPERILNYIPASLISKIKEQKEIRFREGEREAIGIIYPDHSNYFVIIASAYDKYGLSKLRNLKITLITGLLISVGITILAGLFYSEQALKPISNVVNEVDKITINNLNLRVKEGNGTDEIALLAITFNKMLERLDSAFEMQKSFVSNASHELRTPLTAITGHIEVTLMNKRSNEEYEQILSSLLEDIKNLNRLSDGLLELAQASLDISKIPVKDLRLDELLWQARTELLKRIDDYHINIEFENLPDDEEKLIIKGSDQLLKTAFINLMDNACKFSDNNEVKVLIGFNETGINLQFIDNGIGISQQDMKKIFEPFYRAENARSIRGHGIGLSITEKIFIMHNGTIHINSIINTGTTVMVNIPHEHNLI
jgi:signal transduction histidine kinase